MTLIVSMLPLYCKSLINLLDWNYLTVKKECLLTSMRSMVPPNKIRYLLKFKNRNGDSSKIIFHKSINQMNNNNIFEWEGFCMILFYIIEYITNIPIHITHIHFLENIYPRIPANPINPEILTNWFLEANREAEIPEAATSTICSVSFVIFRCLVKR